MSSHRKARSSVAVSPGESVRIIRELQGMSQNELAKASGIPRSTISAIERERTNLGTDRAKQIARALKCHPAVLVLPISDKQRRELGQRLEAYRLSNDPDVPAAEAIERIREGL